ncbi:MAG: hypothetical protein JWQ70_2629 [Aeromicrobium sp.]|nr:hypothetical protein [Aeromicrobium sp.]
MFAMGWFEIGVVVLVGAIVLLALLGGGTYDIADETIVPGISVETADQVLFRELSDLRSLTLVESHAGSYTLARSSSYGAAYVAAVLLFPFGLVFLLLKQEHRVQVSLAGHSGGCRVRVVGRARRRDVNAVAAALERVLPVPVIVR